MKKNIRGNTQHNSHISKQKKQNPNNIKKNWIKKPFQLTYLDTQENMRQLENRINRSPFVINAILNHGAKIFCPLPSLLFSNFPSWNWQYSLLWMICLNSICEHFAMISTNYLPKHNSIIIANSNRKILYRKYYPLWSLSICG